MSRLRVVVVLVVVCLLSSTVSCSPDEPLIALSAEAMNLSATDLGTDWVQLGQDMGVSEIPDVSTQQIRDANWRMFGAGEGTGTIISMVLSGHTVDAARAQIQTGAVQDIGAEISEQMSGIALEALDAPSIGQETILLGGTHTSGGLNIYVLAFRQANVVAVLSLIGSEDLVNQDTVADYGRALEAKIGE